MANKPYPPPEWFDEMRLLHLDYLEKYEAIRQLSVPEAEKRQLAGDLWFETSQRRKLLEKQALRGLPCTATKKDGSSCARPALPDYIGQMCSSHAPPVEKWPDLAATRRLWSQRHRGT